MDLYTPGDSVSVRYQGKAVTGKIVSIEASDAAPQSTVWLARIVILEVSFAALGFNAMMPGSTTIRVPYNALLGTKATKAETSTPSSSKRRKRREC